MSTALSSSNEFNPAIRDFQGSPTTLGDLLRTTHPAEAVGLYVHIPFCFHKCHYCDFYSIVDDHDRQTLFTDRLIGEIRATAPLTHGPLRSIFVGGGTPTLLRPDLWQRLLTAIHESFALADNLEFTVEANPETVTAELMSVLAAGGVNRLSVGAQSFNPQHLQTLERHHQPENVGRSFTLARQAGIDNVNLDLIFAVPGQTLADWQADLTRALALEPTHLSCYALMYEPNTPLTKKLERGRIHRADEDLEAAMFAHTIATLTAAGFENYEVSNFAKPGRRCRHNLLYWHSENTLAVGPSASGHLNGVRWKNVPHLGRYLASEGDQTPITDVEKLSPEDSLGEQLMLRIRLLDGIEHAWLNDHLDARRREAIEQLITDGLLERTPDHLKLTPRGLMLADTVCTTLL
ncbi:MAG: radical SAM family heme chaperone HemW [Phycisphaeraceae bacterium]